MIAPTNRVRRGASLFGFLLAVLAPFLRAAESDIVVADFEGEDYGAWKVEGEAFGTGPARGPFADQKQVCGFEGKGFANSGSHGDKSTGRLLSPEFVVTRSFIQFLLGGGSKYPRQACINLLVEDRVVRTAAAREGSGETLKYVAWNVADLRGKTVRIEIVDAATGAGGHVMVDDIAQTDRELKTVDFQVDVPQDYLLLPIKNGARKIAFQVSSKDGLVRSWEIELAVGCAPDWWAFEDFSAFRGQKLTVKCGDALPEALAAQLSTLFRPSPEAVPGGDLYHEAFRPQFHFTPRRGWVNDPNGLAYFNGEYHLFYQANPFGLGSWNKHWGHAVSADLVHWTELPPAIYPLKGGAHSGGAFIDHGNRLGFGRGREDVLFASYTGDGERLAFGTGRVPALTDVPANPLLRHKGRDPKIFRYEPGNKWIMVVYEESPQTGYAFYDSPDLKAWRRMFCIEGGNECPEFFEMPVEGETTRKWVLYGCALRTKSSGLGAKSAYMIGTFDGNRFVPETDFLKAHSGPSFYAAQTFSDAPDGRRIMMAWLQGATYPGMPFSQGMTVPLELQLRRTPAGLRLCFLPVRELDQLHGPTAEGKDLSVAEANVLLGKPTSELLDLDLDITAGTSGRFTLNVRGNAMVCDTTAREVSCRGRKANLPTDDRRVRLRVLIDRGALELYTGDGLLGLSFGGDIYINREPVTLEADGEARVSRLRISEMKSIWEK